VADALREGIGAPRLLIGHSLGGAAVLVAARHIPEVSAVATIGAPADAEHVVQNFAAHLDRIEDEGQADVTLAGRTFTIRREFVEDLRSHAVEDAAEQLKAALLVLHAPLDQQVGIDNATRIFVAAKHPKSFVSLDDADHLLSNREDARYAADVIAAWAGRFVGAPAAQAPSPEAAAVGTHHGGVLARGAGGRFAIDMTVNGYRLRADEPESVGGEDTGPSPYDFVSAGLAACTLMTMRLYAERKGWTVDATVEVDHHKVYRQDCEDCADAKPGKDGRIDRFERIIRFGSGTDPEHRERLVEIAGRCPVHRTLERAAAVVTRRED
jgi:putative redox protein